MLGFQESGKLNAEHKGLDTPSEDDNEPHKQSTMKKGFPTRSQNSKLTSRDEQNGTNRDTRHTAYPKGVSRMVVKTDHLRPSGLL